MAAVATLGVALAFCAGTPAGAFELLSGVYGAKGNDTGGIIPWSPENEQVAFDIAQSNCGSWNKYAVATSIHRVPGDYIAYACVWNPPHIRQARYHRHRVNVKIEK
ncbi:MAG TPA: hypothetical protein VNQ50_00955 [Xanthobacteraceae bacterium]|nr:hypothetical protein [Xanthobacteraceae bacterium]